jgi:polysaccharide pyruvyl transferase WcaK-like protein
MFAQLLAVVSLGKRVGVFPFSIAEPTVLCNGRVKLKEYLESLDFPLLARDVLSHQTLKSIGVKSVHVSDSVFTTSPLFQKERAICKDQSRLAYISVTSSKGTNAEDIVALVCRIRKIGFKPVLFSSCEVEDRPLVDKILSIESIEYCAPDSWKSAVSHFAEAAFVITNRLHCLIFAALGGTAVVPVTNRVKTEAYAEDAELSLHAKSVKEITTKFLLNVISDLPEIRRKQVSYLERSSAQTIRALDSFLAD